MTDLLRKSIFLACLLAVVLFSRPAQCQDDESSLDLGASLRTVGAFTRNYDFPAYFGAGNSVDFVSQSIFRITAEAQPSERLAYEAHLVNSADYSTGGSGSSLFGITASSDRYRAFDAELARAGGRRSSARMWLDRFNVRLSLARADLTIGRQAVTFGKAWFWNPLDVFMPFDPDQFDRDYKPGVDAVRLDYYTGDYSGWTVVAAAGREQAPPWGPARDQKTLAADSQGSALLLRGFATRHGWDYAVQGGALHGGMQLGAAAVGEVGPYQLRIEAARFFSDNSPVTPLTGADLVDDHLTAVFGIGRYYKSTLDVELEYLYNGCGEPDDPDTAWLRVQYGACLHTGKHILGAMAAYEFTPLINGRLTLIHSLSDQSSQVQPSAVISRSDNSDLLLGATFNFGRRPGMSLFGVPSPRSEFGTYPHMIYTEYKIYY